MFLTLLSATSEQSLPYGESIVISPERWSSLRTCAGVWASSQSHEAALRESYTSPSQHYGDAISPSHHSDSVPALHSISPEHRHVQHTVVAVLGISRQLRRSISRHLGLPRRSPNQQPNLPWKPALMARDETCCWKHASRCCGRGSSSTP